MDSTFALRSRYFMQLRRRLSLVAGAVPVQGNVVAVLEKTGKIILVRLTSNGRDGLGSVNSEDAKPTEVPASLCSKTKLSMNCLRFDPHGAHLFAIDTKGKLIRTRFKILPQTDIQ